MGQLNHLRHSGAVQLRVSDVEAAHVAGEQVRLLGTGEELVADRVVLATGFHQGRPGGEWLDRAVLEHDLSVAPCGYPAVDARLRWAPGLHVSGALAELEIGPVARNLLGARLAGERLNTAA
jgi:hypothetical protein